MEDKYRRLGEISNEFYELERQRYVKISTAKIGTLGTSTYPDVIFILRLAFDSVKSYFEDGKKVER